jgi:CheY-like chemotaxis protein
MTGGPLHILLADDNPATRSQVAALLERLGHETMTVENGTEAVSALAVVTFDLVIVDLDMPGPDGPEIAARQGSGGMPVIGLSPADGTRDDWGGAPIRAWLRKPVGEAALAAAIDTALGTPVTTGSAVDLAHLATYTAGDPSLEKELAELFRVSTDRYLAEMRRELDGQGWKDAAHGLKGAARGIGANEVARLAAYAEKLQGAAVRARRETVLPEIAQAVEEAHACLARHLDGA